MNILVIPSWYSNNKNPTNGSFFREQALELRKAGHTVIIAHVEVTLDNLSPKQKQIQYIDDDGLKTFRLLIKKLPKTGNIGTAIVIRSGLLKIFEEVKTEYKIDIIHLHSCLWSGLGAVAISKKYKIPLVITEHSSFFIRKKFNFIEDKIVKYTLINSNKIICVSNYLKLNLEKYKMPVDVIPNMIDCELFNLKNRLDNTQFTFLTVCYLNKNKRIDLLIRAFAYKFKGRDCRLVIGGDGPERKTLEGLCVNLTIENQVQFLGKLDRIKVAEEMKNCSVFVLPSKVETFGVVYIEAMACGKPVISTLNGGTMDIITEETGIIVENDDYFTLGNAMENIINNYFLYDSQKISDYCKSHYSSEVIISRIEEIYLNILN